MGGGNSTPMDLTEGMALNGATCCLQLELQPYCVG